MPSTYPQQLDVFPGAPYVDQTEYIHASYANAWVSAILALEQTLGVGSGNTTSNPLYSVPYGVGYSSVSERLSAAESALVGTAPINSESSAIAPVGVTEAAGDVGRSADAGHVHQGVTALTAGVGLTISGGDGNGHGSLTISSLPLMSAHTYAVSGPIVVPSGGMNYFPPFFEPVATDTTKTLVSVWYVVRSGMVTFSIGHNGTAIAGLSNLTAGVDAAAATPTSTVDVTNGDLFSVVVSSVSSAPDGLSVSFFFETVG